MAMEKQYVVRETHTRTITALGYNPIRREIVMGCEDGVIKSWEAEAGKLVSTTHEHRGWITDFLYWPAQKLLLSSANDGIIVAWGSGGGISDKLLIGQPVYSMVINPRRHQLVCGVSGAIRVYDLDDEREGGHVIRLKVVYVAREHTDIVRCLICHESRVYSAGYDQRIIIYDSSYTGDKSMVPISINEQAHDAGISCLMLVKDNENNTWIVTGSFDKTVKIWSPDGKLVHKLEGFLATISGICYVPRNKTIWAAGGTSYAYLYDPKSGDNVSDFIGTFQTQEEEKYQLQLLRYFPEINQVVGSTSRRHLIVWKYNSSGCITALKCKAPIESLAYTRKVPILIFSGDSEGMISKWERMQSNHFMYSKELFLLSDARKGKKKKRESKDKNLEGNKKNLAAVESHYAFNKPMVPSVSHHFHRNTSILKIVFVEDLDLIIASCEDGNIYVWGFDEEAVEVLKNMKGPDDSSTLTHKYAILLDQNSQLLSDHLRVKTSDEDSVTNRVAGFMCKFILSEHTSCVTSLAVIGRNHGYNTTYVVSAGWDRRICIWDLEAGRLHDIFRNSSLQGNLDHVELASDGIITDLVYCATRNEFAYSSSDKMIYIRRFSPEGSGMVLLNTLQGHYGEVTCIEWNPVRKKWVSGSEDGTIRVWASEGLNECEQQLGAQGSIQALCVDKVNGAIVAAIQEYIRVYEPEQFRLVQTNMGHTDAVRSIIHVPERNQYVSASWDMSIRVWNAWKMPKKKRKVSKGKKLTDEMNARNDDDDSGDEKADDATEKDTMPGIQESDADSLAEGL